MSPMRKLLAALVFAGLAGGVEATLPSSGNCSTFTVDGRTLPPLGDQSQNLPSASFQLAISNFQAAKADSSVGLSVRGIANQFPGSGINGNDGIQGAGAWYVIYRCDIANGQFQKLTDHTHSSAVAASSTTFTFTDSTLGASPQSKYHYVAFGLLSTTSSFGNVNPSVDMGETSYTGSLGRYIQGDASSKIAWSDPLYAVADFRPVQPLAVTASNSFGGAAITTGLNTVSAGYTLSATIDATLVSNPAFVWTSSNLPTGLTATAGGTNNGTLTIAGSFTAPGVFNTSVTAQVATSHTTTLNQSFVVTPPGIAFVTPADALGSVQISRATTYTVTTTGGMASFDGTNYEVVYTVTTQPAAGTVSFSGSQMTVDLSQVATVGTALNFTVQASVQCKTGGTCNPLLFSTNNRTFTATTANEFAFAQNVLTWAAGFAAAPANLSNYAQIRHGSGLGSVDIGLSGAGSTVAVTYSISGGATATGAAIESLSQLGLVFTSSTSGAIPSMIAETSLGSSASMTGATFVLTIGAFSSGALPQANIQTTVAFILLDGSRPVVSSTPVFDAFNWGVSGKSQFLPVSVAQTLRVTYSKALTVAPVARVMFSNGVVVNGTATIGNPANEVSYSLDFTSLSTAVAPSTANNSLAVSEISLDDSGRDTQPAALTSFRNSSVTSTWNALTYAVVNPLKTVTTDLGTNRGALTAFAIGLNKSATVTAGSIASNIGNVVVDSTTVTGVTTITVRPATKYTYGANGLTLNSTQILDVDGLPLLNASNVAANVNVAVTIEADTYKPVLVSQVSRQSSALSTAVTFTAVFDEAISTCTVSVTPMTGGLTTACQMTGSVATVSLGNLSNNRRYEVMITVSDAATNAATVNVSYATLATEEASFVENTAPPFVLALTPDLQDGSVSLSQPLLPIVKISFSEPVTGGTVALVHAGTQTSVNSSVSGTGNFRVVMPSAQLSASTTYRLEVSGFTGSNGAMTAQTYTFQTVASGFSFAAPQFQGSPVTNQVVARDSSLVFFFSEPLNTDSLVNGFTLTSTGGAVAGQWVVSGRSHTFSPSVKLSAGTTYTYRFSNQVLSLNGMALAADVSGTFNTLAANAPSMFAVNVNSTGTEYLVTAAWLPGEETSGSYRLSFRTAAGASFSGTASVLTTIAVDATGIAKVTTSNTFTAISGQNAEFILETLDTNNTVIATSRANVYFLPAQNDVVVTVPVSVTSGKVATIAVAAETGATVSPVQVKIDPSALKTSANIQVQTVSNASTLNALPGGGNKVAAVVQFGPDGTKFLSPVEIGMRFNPTAIGGGTAAVLMGKVNPVVFKPENQRWSSMGLGKARVEIINATEAVLYFLTNHFSVFSVGEALLFQTIAGQLTVTEANNQLTSEVRWSAPVLDSDVTLASSGSASGVTTQAIRQDGSSTAMIGIRFVLPNPVTQSINAQYTISLNDSGTTTSAVYTLVREATGGSTTFNGTPRNVDTFTAVQSGASTAQLTWTITSDATDLQINSVVIEVAKRNVSSAGSVTYSTATSFSMNRAVLTTSITGLDAGATYRFKVYTTSFVGNRSAASGDVERFTYGAVLAGLPVGNQTLDTLNVVVTGNQVFAKRFSAAELLTVTGTGAILSSTTVLSNGATLLQTGLFDFSFTGAGSAAITLPGDFSKYVMYHYDAGLNSGAGAWELLQTPALAPNAQLNATIVAAGGNTTVTIASKGIAGSPFALAIPPAATTSSSSGGCLSIAGVSGNPLHGALNFLLMLLPVGMLWFRRNR